LNRPDPGQADGHTFRPEPKLGLGQPLLEEPLNTGGKEVFHMYLRIFNYDPSLAPEGKTVVQALMETDFDHWYHLQDDRAIYENEKAKVANAVQNRVSTIGILSLNKL
jgi:hypothetical protein